MKKHKKEIAYFISAIMVVGGIMGLIKNNIPELSNFDFRHILTGTVLEEAQVYPTYIRIYGSVMAALEIFTFPIFIKYTRRKVYYIIAVLAINGAVCLACAVFGDLFATVSLAFRLIGILLLIFSLRN